MWVQVWVGTALPGHAYLSTRVSIVYYNLFVMTLYGMQMSNNKLCKSIKPKGGHDGT